MCLIAKTLRRPSAHRCEHEMLPLSRTWPSHGPSLLIAHPAFQAMPRPSWHPGPRWEFRCEFFLYTQAASLEPDASVPLGAWAAAFAFAPHREAKLEKQARMAPGLGKRSSHANMRFRYPIMVCCISPFHGILVICGSLSVLLGHSRSYCTTDLARVAQGLRAVGFQHWVALPAPGRSAYSTAQLRSSSLAALL